MEARAPLTAEQYRAWTAPVRRHPWGPQALRAVNRGLTLLGYVAYPLLLLWVGAAALVSGGDVLFGDAALAAAGGVAGSGALAAGDPVRVGVLWQLFRRELLVPAVSFGVLSLARARIDAPRPYEVLAIDPLISKNTRGRSFPSRHVFSSFVIAMGWLAWRWPVGVALLVASAMLAVVRVLGGVHWPRDVIVGALLGIAAGVLILL